MIFKKNKAENNQKFKNRLILSFLQFQVLDLHKSITQSILGLSQHPGEQELSFGTKINGMFCYIVGDNKLLKLWLMFYLLHCNSSLHSSSEEKEFFQLVSFYPWGLLTRNLPHPLADHPTKSWNITQDPRCYTFLESSSKVQSYFCLTNWKNSFSLDLICKVICNL